MPILDLFEKAPESISILDARQIASNCGNGLLRGNQEAQEELRQYLVLVDVVKLIEYSDYCLNNVFDNGPYMLQDIVNEFGRRLNFQVTNGVYSGSRRADVIGYDGIWKLPDGKSLVIEVKTTDAYAIDISTIDNYRQTLVDAADIQPDSTNLIVVGRITTEALESQVRGSRYNWNTRIISIDSLSKMALINVESESEDVLNKLREILQPTEYTRVDKIIEMVFATSKDKEAPPVDDSDISEVTNPLSESTHAINQKRSVIVAAFIANKNVRFIKRKQASYSDAADKNRIVVAISKNYLSSSRSQYWYAFHDSQVAYLNNNDSGYFLLGCLDTTDYFAIPIEDMNEFSNRMRVSHNNGRSWRHVEIKVRGNNHYLYLSPEDTDVPLTKFHLSHP